uniref:Transposase n=1 Tax=Candidatus Kentrum sp. FW TaxID=2126338 RepID=A0A450S678_9GAMM|nr:MAG: transposase [Candidatus Kentron sp. FW]
MRDTDLYTRISGIEVPWQVSTVKVEMAKGEIIVHVERKVGAKLCCPICGRESQGYDSRRRRWHHLDTCQYKTILEADIPRVECPEHGVVATSVPWAEPNSGFTAMFKALVIDRLKKASTAAVWRLMGLSWNAIDKTMQQAVKRGLARRGEICARHLGVDETAFKTRHDYVTIVSDQDESKVLHVSSDRKKAGLKKWYESLPECYLQAIESVSILESLLSAQEKIAFDKFHVTKYLGEAVDKVRRQEHRVLMTEGHEDLKGSKHDWLYNQANMTPEKRRSFRALRESTLKTAHTWAIKELAISL